MMSSAPMQIKDLSGSAEGTRILRLAGPLVLPNLSSFMTNLREDNSRALILDFTAVPFVDSAGIGALVGAFVRRQKDGRTLALVGVNQRVHNALEMTRVESLFRFYESVADAEQAQE